MKYSLLNINFYILIVLNQIDFTKCILPYCARKMMRGTYQSHLIAQSFFLSYFVYSNFMMTLCFSSSLLVFYMQIYWFEKLSQNIWYISINKKKKLSQNIWYILFRRFSWNGNHFSFAIKVLICMSGENLTTQCSDILTEWWPVISRWIVKRA